MAAPEKNQFWKLRSSHGRDLIFSTPEILWKACMEYFEATDSRKWVKKDWVGKDAHPVERETETPYTWTGLFLFLDCSHTTWQDYEKREDFIAICTRVRQIIYTQKFEGAAVGAFNPVIISRDLGLKDQSEVEAKNINYNVTPTPEEAAEIKKALDKSI
jgi:hypothetical protein